MPMDNTYAYQHSFSANQVVIALQLSSHFLRAGSKRAKQLDHYRRSACVLGSPISRRSSTIRNNFLTAAAAAPAEPVVQGQPPAPLPE